MFITKTRIREYFEKLGHFVYQNRLKTIFVSLLFVGAMVSQLPKMTIDVSTEAFFLKDDPTIEQYNAFRDQFGRDQPVIIAIKSNKIFSQRFLGKLKNLHNTLEKEVPNTDGITSMINTRNTRGEKDHLIVEVSSIHSIFLYLMKINRSMGLKIQNMASLLMASSVDGIFLFTWLNFSTTNRI